MKFESDLNQTPQELGDYLRSSQAYWYWTIVILASTTALLAFVIPENAFPIVYARYILGSFFLLWLPGYAFTRALFPKKELDIIESVVLNMGMSLVWVSIVGLLLNYTPSGISLQSVTVSLLVLTCALATAAITRDHQAQRRQKDASAKFSSNKSQSA